MLRLLLLAPFGARGMECSSILDGTSCGINGRCGTDPSTRESKCLLEDVIACEGKAWDRQKHLTDYASYGFLMGSPKSENVMRVACRF